jgi:hypothetical protein
MNVSFDIMVEVFKTNVGEKRTGEYLISKLLVHFPGCRINFDLQDCDRILRVEGRQIRSEKVIEVMNTNGYQCQVLE